MTLVATHRARLLAVGLWRALGIGRGGIARHDAGSSPQDELASAERDDVLADGVCQLAAHVGGDPFELSLAVPGYCHRAGDRLLVAPDPRGLAVVTDVPAGETALSTREAAQIEDDRGTDSLCVDAYVRVFQTTHACFLSTNEWSCNSNIFT